jgi:hypothetical protein
MANKSAKSKGKWDDVVDEICQCGHRKSGHLASPFGAAGHGACLKKRCKCAQFRWKAFVYAKKPEVAAHGE